MTVRRPSDERLDEALRNLGLIAIGAASLEANLARVAALSDDTIEYSAALRMPNKKKVEIVKAGLRVRRNLGGTERRDAAGRLRAIRWAQGALELLRQRGDLMHSEWIISRRVSDHREPRELLSHHLSSGHKTPIDPDELQILADQITAHSRRYISVYQFAMRATPYLPRSIEELEALD